MTVRELIIELLKYDLDLPVYAQDSDGEWEREPDVVIELGPTTWPSDLPRRVLL